MNLPKTFFVVIPEQVIAHDLAHAIRSFDPEAEVRLFPSEDDAMVTLLQVRPDAALLQGDPQGPERSALVQVLREMAVPHAHIGVMEGAADALVLASPFSEATVAKLLRQLLAPLDKAEP